jgi:hypothetical protein
VIGFGWGMREMSKAGLLEVLARGWDGIEE